MTITGKSLCESSGQVYAHLPRFAQLDWCYKARLLRQAAKRRLLSQQRGKAVFTPGPARTCNCGQCKTCKHRHACNLWYRRHRKKPCTNISDQELERRLDQYWQKVKHA